MFQPTIRHFFRKLGFLGAGDSEADETHDRRDDNGDAAYNDDEDDNGDAAYNDDEDDNGDA